jgi:DNA-binding response OmpR family regulator
MRILLVDDDPDMVEVTTYALRKQGYQIVTAGDGREALQRWREDRPDLVLLDIGLPRMNGIEVCRTIRESSSTPVIMLTGYGEEERVIQGYQAGADDYVTKPFSHRQLAARIRAVLKRSQGQLAVEPVGRVETRDLKLDVDSHVVTRGERAVHLTPLEFDLLVPLAAEPGIVFSRERLLDELWDAAYDGDPSTVTVHIRRLREKIEADPSLPRHLITVWGAGYRFDP